MEDITEDRVKVLASEVIDKCIENYKNNFCETKHSQLEKDRMERGERIKDIEISLKELAICVNGKFNKMYYLLFGLLVAVITTLITVITK